MRVDGETVEDARRPPRGRSWERSSRRGNGASSASLRLIKPLDSPSRAAIIPRPPERDGSKRSRNSTTGAPSERSGYDPNCLSRRPLARVGGFLLPPRRRQRSLKTQQHAFTSRTLVVASPSRALLVRRWSARGISRRPGSPSRSSLPTSVGQDTLSTSSTGDKLAGLGRQRVLHGEFDPGSGRTLAARLTHASRARTRASALGTAANG